MNLEDDQILRESVNRALHVLRFTIHSDTKKTPFELHFERTPRTKLSNLRNSISVDTKDLWVYITRNSARQITDHLVMSKKKMAKPKYKRGLTFSQTTKPNSSVSTNKFEYPFRFYEKKKKLQKRSMESKFKNKIQTAVSGTKHTVTTDKNKTIRKQINFQPVAFSANYYNIDKKDKHPPKCCRSADLLQNFGHCEHWRIPLHLQQ